MLTWPQEFHPLLTSRTLASAEGVTPFMVLGSSPNTMNRFKHSDSNEVLFVN
jgi:hypothetical protein